MRRVVVAGVGMIPFAKPGASETYDVMAARAAREALADARVAYGDVQQAYAGYVYGDSTAGQKALYGVGMTGIPVVNVNNNCSTGSTALFLARQAVASGAADCALAVGFEQMAPGALTAQFPDRPTPFDAFDRETDALVGHPEIPLAIRYFGGAGLAHMKKYGTTMETFAQIRAKASRHAARNPLALFRKEVSVDDVLASPVLMEGVMTRLMACPPTCGAAAAVLVSEDFSRRHGSDATVSIAAQTMTTDTPDTFAAHDMMELVGYGMAKTAAHAGLRGGGHRAGGRRRRRAPRLLRAERAHQLRGARPVPRGGRREVRRRRRQHLRRAVRDQSVRRPPVEGASARRDRARAMLRAHAAAARQRRPSPGRRRESRPAAQPRAGRRVRRHALSRGLTAHQAPR